jgi:hypothetical protein
MIWLLKLLFDQNSIIINHKFNGDFNSHIIFSKNTSGLSKIIPLEYPQQTLQILLTKITKNVLFVTLTTHIFRVSISVLASV